MSAEQIAAVPKEPEISHAYWRPRLARQVAVLAVTLGGLFVFRAMNWPSSVAAVMGVWLFLQLVTEPNVPGAPPTPIWRRVAVATVFAVLGAWLISLL